MARYRRASDSADVEGVLDTLTPDIELASPISGRMVFRGRDDLRVLLGAVFASIEGLRWHEELGEGDLRVLVGEGRVGPLRITDAMVCELAEDGRIRRLAPHMRPWLALTLLALELGGRLARHPGVILRALRG
jgi:hypothetical protein